MKFFYLIFAAAFLLAGCGKQTKINSQKIDLLAQKIVQLEQSQSQQMTALQAQLTSLAPMLDRMNNSYFEKNRDDALFFHTNTLFLLVTVGKQIEAQLQAADADRAAQNALVFSYHTNQLNTMYLCTAQIENEMTDQENRIENNVNAATKELVAALNDDLQKQIKSAAAPDPAEVAQRNAMAAQITQIQRDLDVIKSRLAATNPP